MALSPTSSHGSSLPSQWTSDATSGALAIAVADGGAENAALDITLPNSGGYMNGAPYIIRAVERVANIDLLRMDVSDGANGYSEVRIQQPGGGGAANIFVGSYGITLRDTNGNRVYRLLTDGVFTTLAHAAPADGTLLTGEMAIWFDQTAAAAKLMIKAKDSGGTVRTASVALA